MASTRLHRTPGSASNQVKWTWSAWVKKCTNASSGALFCAYTDANNYTELDMGSNQIDYYNVTGGGVDARRTTSAYQRDPAAWYHIVVVWDSANASAGDRMKVYINGVEQTSFSATTDPSSSLNSIMNSTAPQEIGARATGGSTFFNGNMAHVHFCDGQAYAASDFGETDSTSGIWIAKTSPSVTYGTNGYFLKFASGASGTDSSGNGNNMTVSGTLTNLKDTPDNNFATFNPLNMTTVYQPTFSNVNTTVVSQDGSGNYWGSASTLGMKSGKWYAEFKAVTASNKPSFGITQAPNECAYWESYLGKRLYDYAYISDGGIYNNDSETASWGNTFTTGDIIMVALDLDNNKIYFGKNGTWENSGDPTSGATGTGAAYTITSTDASTPGVEASGYYHFACSDQGSGQDTMAVNFGNGYFQTTAVTSAGTSSSGDDSVWEYDCPSGYYGLNTKNLGSYS